MTGDDFLETLQADVVDILKAVPTLVDVKIIPEDDGDMEAKITRMLGSLTGSATNKPGSVAVVMLPEITEAESNLPGPPVKVNVRVQVIEQHLINRDSSGSGVRSSVGALRVLNALHHHGMAYTVLYAGNKPVEPVDGMKKGYISHMVTLTADYRGITGPGKPAQVAAVMGTTVVAGTPVAASAIVTVDLLQFGFSNATQAITIGGRTYYFWDSSALAAGSVRAGGSAGECAANFTHAINGTLPDPAPGILPYDIALTPVHATVVAQFLSDSEFPLATFRLTARTAGTAGNSIATVSDCPAVIFAGATLAGGSAGVGVTTEALILTCATSGAAIYYTTDGDYPNAANGTLYTTPITGLAVGTVVRAAAFKSALNPGDVTEILITD